MLLLMSFWSFKRREFLLIAQLLFLSLDELLKNSGIFFLFALQSQEFILTDTLAPASNFQILQLFHYFLFCFTDSHQLFWNVSFSLTTTLFIVLRAAGLGLRDRLWPWLCPHTLVLFLSNLFLYRLRFNWLLSRLSRQILFLTFHYYVLVGFEVFCLSRFQLVDDWLQRLRIFILLYFYPWLAFIDWITLLQFDFLCSGVPLNLFELLITGFILILFRRQLIIYLWRLSLVKLFCILTPLDLMLLSKKKLLTLLLNFLSLSFFLWFWNFPPLSQLLETI